MNKWKATVDVGATFEQPFFYYAGAAPVDLTGWTGYFRFFSSSGALLLELGSPGAYGSMVIDAALGKLLLNVTAQGTPRLTGRTGTYELWITDGTTTLRLLDGPAQYSQRGSGTSGTTSVLISRTTSAVTVERATINELKIVDRGPPGARGLPGPNLVGGAAALSVSTNTEGVSAYSARRDHSHLHDAQTDPNNHAVATTSAHGFFSSTDKTNHDRSWVQVKFGPAPSGDVTGATDTAALQAVIAAAKAAKVGVLLYPGVYYINDELDISNSSTYLEGAATGAYGLTSGTVIEDVRAVRTANKYLIRAEGAWTHGCVRRISMAVNRSHGCIYMGLVSSQPTSNIVEHCFLSARDYVAATSTDSLACTTGSKVVNYTGAAAAWDGVMPSFTVGTRIWLGSRSGVKAHMVGEITAWNGTSQFTFLADECWDTDGTTVDPGLSGAHTDWDIRFPVVGIDAPSCANTTFDHLIFTGLYHAIRGEGSYNLTIGPGCIIAVDRSLGPQFRAGDSAQHFKVDANYEPSLGGWCHFVALGTVANARLSLGTGDPGTRGSLVYLDDSLNVEICNGMLSKNGGDAAAIIRARGTTGLSVRDCELLIGTSGRVVDFGSGSNNFATTLDCPRVAEASLYRGTSFTRLNYRDTSGIWTYDRINTNFAKFVNGYQRQSGTVNVAYGANNLLSLANGLTYLTASGSAGPIEIRGCSIALDGQVARVRSTVAQYLTFPHNHATPSAGNRFAISTASDMVFAPPASGGFVEVELEFDSGIDPGNGRVKVHALTPPVAPGVQSGTTTLVAGVSPAVSCYLKNESVVTWGLEGPAGTALTTEYGALAADRTNGTPGSFKITALLAAGTIDIANTSTLRWTVTTP